MGSESTRVHLRHTGSTTSSLQLRLRRLTLCLDCEACFEIGPSSCPACSGRTWVPLARYLNRWPLKLLSQFKPLPKSWAEGPKHGEDASEPVVKQLVIVARDRQKLYENVKRAFSDNPSVEVILDRRSAESLDAKRANATERRRGYDQQRFQTDCHLRALGWAIVRLDVFRTLGRPHGGASR